MRRSNLTPARFCISLSIILPLSACLLSAQNTADNTLQNAQIALSEEGRENREASNVEQVGMKSAQNNIAAEQIASKEEKAQDGAKANVTITQLPADLEAVPGSGPEGSIGSDTVSPEVRLYEKVAQVWYTLRQRGIQPTPERIAEEIGPDQLARFLDQNPSAGSIFGTDSDTLPIPKPGDENNGGIIEFIPPQNGGG